MPKNCCKCCGWCHMCKQICLECFVEELEMRRYSKLSAFPNKNKDGDISPK